jgi:hypothetical protein
MPLCLLHLPSTHPILSIDCLPAVLGNYIKLLYIIIRSLIIIITIIISIDRLLDGDLLPGHIVELFGLAGSGKTQVNY